MKFKIVFNDQYLYLVVRVHEPNTGKLKINEFRRDGLVYMGDSIEFLVDPYGVWRSKKLLSIYSKANAAGVQFEGKRSNAGLIHELE